MLIAFALLPTLVLYPFPVKAADSQSSWTSMTPMPTARGEFGLAVVNGKIYAIGGKNGDSGPLNTVEEYNPQTNLWISKASMPTPRSGFAIAVYQNKIYVIGGTVGTGFVGNNEAYDPIHNTWETKTSMPTPRSDLIANLVDDKLYLIGGKKYSGIPPFFNKTDINEVYDISNDSWSTKTPIITPVQGYSSAVFNDKIYIMGGSLDSLPIEESLTTNVNQVYDPQNDSWDFGSSLLNAVSYPAAAVTEGFMALPRIYCIGGFFDRKFSGQVQAYNLENNSWKLEDSMPTPRAYLAIAVVNDVLYAIGGFDGTNWLNVNEQYKPVGYGTVAPKVLITSPENKTYSSVSLEFTANRGTDWIGYSLDNQANETLNSEEILSSLTNGAHNITIYANDSLGNMGSSNTVFFSVDTLPPDIEILMPQNKTYDSADIQLSFTLNEAVTYLAYSLDGQENITIIGNVTLPVLSDGSHHLTLYATDELGNSAGKMIAFNIAPFPIIAVAAALATTVIILAGGYLFFKRRRPSSVKKGSKVRKTC